MMSNYPDLGNHHYRIERVLKQPCQGKQTIYLARHLETHQAVMIKQYPLTQGGNWQAYRAYQSEIEVLRSLYSENIPRYLDAFETPTGVCLVQEYKPAALLSSVGVLSPSEVKQIALAVLEILVYLHKQDPPVIHGNLRPDTILVDRRQRIKVYIADFSSAKLGSGRVGINHLMQGSIGFIPPEELFHRQLTPASDLYGLGITLICLLTQIPANEIEQLIDPHQYRLSFKHHLRSIHPQFLAWLDKMVAPCLSDRFPDALTALKSLRTLPIEGNNPLMLLQRQTQRSPTSFIVSIGVLAAITLTGITGVIYWQGRTVRQLLKTSVCQECNLQSISLLQANLRGANLSGANLEDAHLKDSDLKQADLRGANLSNAYLKGADLQGANLEGATLSGINLIEANLQGANLAKANLEGATLNAANLAQANLQSANLLNANLKSTRLIGTNFKGAILGGTNLEGANFEQTIMPDGNLLH